MLPTTFTAAPGTDRVLRASDAQLERLSSELNGYQAAWRAKNAAGSTFRDLLAWIRATHRLEAAAVDCGMSIDEPNLEEWSAEAVADFLRRA